MRIGGDEFVSWQLGRQQSLDDYKSLGCASLELKS